MITINGKTYECDENDSILNVARKNGVYIPAICYLNGCSPTLACRLCMVEADEKVVYSCNAKAKDGLNVITNSPELDEARRAIMQTYCINHPSECGVCDQSGECELQNMAHQMQVNEVPWAIRDSYRPIQKWGIVEYEPSLCIVCERCITACKDRVGEERLKLVSREADLVPKELKDEIPKDAFAVWNKFQKSLIGLASGADTLECSECGECAAVCPVGALTESHFTYNTNAWELTKIPASNPHASDCELMYYEVKTASIEDRTPKIYRVSSDIHFAELDKAARFGFDFHNGFGKKDEEKFNQLVEAIKNKKIKNIKFNSFITNEEAKILDELREKFDLNLVNDEARVYQDFLRNFAIYLGKDLYSGDVKPVLNADFIVVAGSFLRHDAPNLSYKVNNALKINKASGVYFHPLKDSIIQKQSKNFISCEHKASVDIEILLFLLKEFGENLPKWLEIPENLGESLGIDMESFEKISQNKENKVLIIGEDFITSKNAPTLAKLTGLIEKHSSFKTLIIPPRTNSLGVAKICKLSEENSGKTLGYNEKGDFEFGVYGECLDAPALNQQEGTFLNLDRRVVPTNRALPYYGYELNDIAKALGLTRAQTIDYTSNLGANFKSVEFDELENFYDNGGVNKRGYKFETKNCDILDEKFKIENLNQELESFVYLANPIGQFSKFSNRASLLSEVAYLYAGDEFMEQNKLNEGDIVNIGGNVLSVKKEREINGAYIPYFDDKIDVSEIFKSSRFANLELIKRSDSE
ncbi:MAG: NADH-quinone oxidoreductase subunit G [Campylobacter sp.]|nr:NADH-quinone oxidoreductase subunit G [Campylobacter sp.]